MKCSYQLCGLLICLIVGMTLNFLKVSAIVDRYILDSGFRIYRQYYPQPIDNDVVIIGIDEAAYAALREPFALWHPHLGKLFTALSMAKPKVVGLDIVLPSRSYNFLIPMYDQSLLQGLIKLKMVSPVLLSQTLNGQNATRKIFPPYVSVAGINSLTSVMVCLDDDGIARNFSQSLCSSALPIPSLAKKMAEIQGGAKFDNEGLVDYRVGSSLSYIPFTDVLSWYDKGDIVKLEQTFSGHPVLLGVILPFVDRVNFPVPFASWEPKQTSLPGVLFHAQSYRSLQMHGLIYPLPTWLVRLLIIAAAFFWLGGLNRLNYAAIVIFVVGMPLVSTLLLGYNLYLPVGAILTTGLIAFIGRASYEAVKQMRERRLLRGTFGNYVSPQILQEILAGHIKPGLNGEKKRLCVLFADIRNFTSRSEQQSPEAVLKLLNGYFTEMTMAIHHHAGTVDKFIGDGIMAFFGAPQTLACPEKNALNAAHEMLVRLADYNALLIKQNIEPINIGIGLHVGSVIVGNVGSETRNEYTVIGDVVNTASRLEGLTKFLGYPVICSATVVDATGLLDGMVDLAEQAIKGHSDVRVYGWNPLAMENK
jgi:class 3 adenylate cyclase/CHASE2 domain-containing sensor protein